MIQKHCHLLWAKALKWAEAKWKTFLWLDELKFYILFVNHRRQAIHTKEERDILADYQVLFSHLIMYLNCCQTTY